MLRLSRFGHFLGVASTLAVLSAVGHAQIAPPQVTPPRIAPPQIAPPKTAVTGDLGFVNATGNTRLVTMSLGDKIGRTSGLWSVSQTAAYVYGQTDHSTSANQLRVTLRTDFGFNPRVGAFAGGAFERNTFAGRKRRTDEIAGLKWKAIVAPNDSLSLDGGGVLTQQIDIDGTKKSFPSSRLGGAYKHSFAKNAYIAEFGEYIPDLQSAGAYRVNSESAVVAPLSSHIGIKTSYVVRFDSKPPVKFGTTDCVLTTGFQVTF